MNAWPSEPALVASVEGRLDGNNSGLVSKQGPTGGETLPESRAIPSSRKRVGRYRLVRLLGAGGMGAVHEAHDEELDRHVAIKLLRERWSESEGDSTVERLRREAKAMAKLAHPNVVAVHDVGVVDDQPYLTMELVDGVTLSAWLREKPRPWRQILEVFVQAGRGLAAAHAVGIVHCDVKPENVLIAKTGRVCVTDFGIATRERDSGESRIQGTPAYMAPEQMEGGPIDARADVFSFCVALYEALHGVRPFTATNAAGLRDAIRAQRANAPVRRGAPSWVREALLRGLRAAPEARYPTMDALLGRLDPAQRGRAARRGVLGVALVLAACAAAGVWRFEARRTAAVAPIAPSVSAASFAPPPTDTPSAAPVTAAATPAPTPVPTTAASRPPPRMAGAPRAPSTGQAQQSTPPSPDCAPPYTLDDRGRKHFKPECYLKN